MSLLRFNWNIIYWISMFFMCFFECITSLWIYLLFSKWFWIYFCIQSIVMVYLWNNTWKVLMQIKERQVKEGYEEFCRTDIHLWNYYRLLAGFIFLVPIRIIGLLFNMIMWFIIFIPLMHFHEGETLGRKMKFVVWVIDKTFWRLMLFFCGYIWISTKTLNYDYSNYLGPGWKWEQPSKYASTFSNHFSWSDVLLFLWKNGGCSFVSSRKVEFYPIVGKIAQKLGCVFVDRAASREEKDVGLVSIKESQRLIFSRPDEMVTLHVFAEGAASNGTRILPYKRGIFQALLPLKPTCILHSSPYFNPAHDIMPYLTHMLVLMAQPYTYIQMIDLPIYYPTDYLFSNHKDLGKSYWEIYANSIRHIMSEVLNIPTSEASLVKKHELMSIIFPESKKKVD